MPPALMERIERRLGAEVQTSWGMTELSPLGTAAVPGDPGRTAGVSGKPANGVDLLLNDAAGRALAEQRGKGGTLSVRGPSADDRPFRSGERAVRERDGQQGRI